MKKLVHLDSIEMSKTVGRKNIIRSKIKSKIAFVSSTKRQLGCVDVVFALMTKNLNSMSEIVYNFTREMKILNNFVENISFDEKRSMTMRAYNAK
jgi:Mg2+ and Co2+ transporter CorA